MKNKRLLFFFNQIFTVRLGEKVHPLYEKSRDNLALLRALGALLNNLVSVVRKKRKLDSVKESHYKHIFFLQTINHRNAVNALVLKLKRQDILLLLYEGINKTSLEFPDERDHMHLPLGRIYFNSLFKLPRAYFLSFGLQKKYKKQINGSHIVVNLALFLASLEIFGKLITHFKVKSVTVINDHSVYPLAWIYAARKMSITSIYIQHASVSYVFPKLLVDTALLEGRQALEIYDRIGNFSKRHQLVGIVRMDGLIGFKTQEIKPKELVAGVCLKGFYPDKLIDELISNLKKSERVGKIILRPHPGSSAGYLKSLERFELPISNAKAEKPIPFLKNIDLLISGESTIILEAALMKIPTLHFDDTVAEMDLYDFIKHQVTFHVKNISEMPDAINSITQKKIDNAFLKSKYYCDTVGTPFENKSVDILLKYYNESFHD